MEFRMTDVRVEEIRDYNEDEVVITLSLNGGSVPLLAGFTAGKEDLPEEFVPGTVHSVYLQAMADPSARLEVYGDETAFMEGHPSEAPESFFPEWSMKEDGTELYVEFANMSGRVLGAEEYDENGWLVKLSCLGYDFSCLIPKDMPAFTGDACPIKDGNIISGEFLLLFDLQSPA